MTEQRKISELTEVTTLNDADELVFVKYPELTPTPTPTPTPIPTSVSNELMLVGNTEQHALTLPYWDFPNGTSSVEYSGNSNGGPMTNRWLYYNPATDSFKPTTNFELVDVPSGMEISHFLIEIVGSESPYEGQQTEILVKQVPFISNQFRYSVEIDLSEFQIDPVVKWNKLWYANPGAFRLRVRVVAHTPTGGVISNYFPSGNDESFVTYDNQTL